MSATNSGIAASIQPAAPWRPQTQSAPNVSQEKIEALFEMLGRLEGELQAVKGALVLMGVMPRGFSPEHMRDHPFVRNLIQQGIDDGVRKACAGRDQLLSELAKLHEKHNPRRLGGGQFAMHEIEKYWREINAVQFNPPIYGKPDVEEDKSGNV